MLLEGFDFWVLGTWLVMGEPGVAAGARADRGHSSPLRRPSREGLVGTGVQKHAALPRIFPLRIPEQFRRYTGKVGRP
jgi:hypothetical protein